MIGKLALLSTSIIARTTSLDAADRVRSAVTNPPPYTTTGPLTSIIIPAYNEEEYLPTLLTTLQNQTYENIEVIVVDDMSEDRTAEVAREYGAVVVIKNDQVCNIAKSRNMGAAAASGEYLIFMDADGAIEHIMIEETVNELESGKDLVYTNHCCTDSIFLNQIRVTLGLIDPVIHIPNNRILSLVSINGQYVAVSREAFDAVGGYDETMIPEGVWGEDRSFAIDVLNYCGIDKVGFLRDCYSSTSARRANQVGMINDITNRIKRYFGYSFQPMDREQSVR